jgi:multiple sugar transport system ATP-binding protein
MAKVRLQGVRKVYDNGQVAVAEATFEAADGELLVLVGPSGCGKSTLLRIIAGLEDTTAGTLSIGDRVVNDVAPKDRDIAMVFQSYALYPHMTVAENLAFGLKLHGASKAQVSKKVHEAAAMLGLDGVLDRRPRALSGGQRQRVALGRALVREPAVFLLDEPLSNLDAKLRTTMRLEIARLHRRLRATMIYVTHDQMEAMTLGQRIVVLDGGHIQQIDTPARLYEQPANLFVAGFLGSPPMNFFRGRLRQNGGTHLDLDGASLPLDGLELAGAGLSAHVGRELVLGVRPEALQLVKSDNAGPVIAARLEVAESVGHEVFLHVRYGSDELIARVAPGSLPEAGADVRLAMPLHRMHFFDSATGQRIERPGTDRVA